MAISQACLGMDQFTVSRKVAVCCSVPEEATTVIVEVEAWTEFDPPAGEPPPQPLSTPNPKRLAASTRSICRRRALRPNQQSPIASAKAGTNGLGLRCSAAIEAEVVTVSVVEEAAPEGVTVAGEKEQEAPKGSPEQVNDTAELKPFWGVTVMEVVPA